jgi:hypothetical protein
MKRLIWKFPERIEFEDSIGYLSKLSKLKNCQIIIDLVDTIYIASSFVGFLIEAKEKMEKLRSTITLLTSSDIEKIFKYLNIFEYLKKG